MIDHNLIDLIMGTRSDSNRTALRGFRLKTLGSPEQSEWEQNFDFSFFSCYLDSKLHHRKKDIL